MSKTIDDILIELENSMMKNTARFNAQISEFILSSPEELQVAIATLLIENISSLIRSININQRKNIEIYENIILKGSNEKQ